MAGRSHPLPIRIAHWIYVAAFVVLVGSGLALWSAYPYFGPLGATYDWIPLQGIEWPAVFEHARARQVHLVGAWLLVGIALGYTGLFVWHRHAYVRRDRIGYAVVLALVAIEIGSGLALWKPVQLHWLAAVFGGYDVARVVHYYAMLALVGFTLAHAIGVVRRWRRR